MDVRERLVLPKNKRQVVLKLVHDGCGHVGSKKMKEGIKTDLLGMG